MEDSFYSSINQPQSLKEATPSSEESGWTTYLDEFMPSDNGYSSDCSSSLVSDADSCPAWKVFNCSKPSTKPAESFKKLNFMKRRTRAIVDGDSLEDTASSSVDSSKIMDWKSLDVKSSKKDGTMSNFKKEVGCSEGIYPRTEERNELCYGGSDCTELKKRGLYSVSLNVLMNYIE